MILLDGSADQISFGGDDFCGCHSEWVVISARDILNEVNFRGFGFNNILINSDFSFFVKYPQGSFDPVNSKAENGEYGGFGVKFRQPKSECVSLAYNIEINENFEFVKGGKLPGIYGGKANSGGVKTDGHDGFSVRLIWDHVGLVYPYVYHAEVLKWGDRLGGGFKLGEKSNIEISVKLNKINKKDGAIKITVNNHSNIFENIIFRKNESIKIDGIFFSTFFGGNNVSFAAKKNEYILMENFRYRYCQLYE